VTLRLLDRARRSVRGTLRGGDKLIQMSAVSVIIPCYNYGHFLPAAIESVLAQTYRDLEVIVVDDGSTDDSAAIADGYPRVACIRQPNLGQGAAQNRGLEAASGEFVLFLDADDQLVSDAVESFVDCLGKCPSCAFGYGHVQFTDAAGSILNTRESRTARLQACLREDPYSYMLRTNNGLRSSGALMYRSAVLRHAGGFALDLGNAQDVDLNLRLAREYPICCNDRIVLSRRFHDANSMRRAGVMLRGAVEAQRRQKPFVSGHPLYERDYRQGLRRARSYWGARLARQIVSEVRSGRVRPAIADSGTLVRYAPRAGVEGLAHVVFGRISKIVPARANIPR
jgi:glycosyltransferase involved in cell wall biosynthesis